LKIEEKQTLFAILDQKDNKKIKNKNKKSISNFYHLF
jgi:flagellar biosynthesis/type III secretory pathway chaperone